MANLNTVGGIHYEMMRRCYNPKSVAYKDYGAKGILVCEEWHDREIFKQWAYENGYEKGMRIERINSKKGYSPDNCKFGISMTRHSERNKRSKEIKIRRRKLKSYSNIDGAYSKTRIYRIYMKMTRRCTVETDKNYKYYGMRGIKICKRWSGKDGFFYFYKWAMENGYNENLTLDRINVNGNYSPQNCRWVDMKTQANNRRNNVMLEYNGNLMTASQVAEIEKVDRELLYRKLKKGMNCEQALSELKMF